MAGMVARSLLMSLKKLVSLLLPESCVSCGCPAPDGEDGFCRRCAATLVRVHPVPGPGPFAAVRYEGSIVRALHAFKYEGRMWRSRRLAGLLAGVWRQAGIQADVIIPVPLAWTRELSRGFNQSALLSVHLSRQVGVPAALSVLRRVRPTAAQAGLSGADREKNVRGCFAVKRPGAVVGRRVVLVDDVLTTGATCREAAAVLRRAGARQVVVLTVARA